MCSSPIPTIAMYYISNSAMCKVFVVCARVRQRYWLLGCVCVVMWVYIHVWRQHYSNTHTHTCRKYLYLVYLQSMYIYVNFANRNLKIISITTIFSSCYRIDFDDSAKPTNLANSAVLRMLEEEENQKRHGNQSGEYCQTLFTSIHIYIISSCNIYNITSLKLFYIQTNNISELGGRKFVCVCVCFRCVMLRAG